MNDYKQTIGIIAWTVAAVALLGFTCWCFYTVGYHSGYDNGYVDGSDEIKVKAVACGVAKLYQQTYDVRGKTRPGYDFIHVSEKDKLDSLMNLAKENNINITYSKNFMK